MSLQSLLDVVSPDMIFTPDDTYVPAGPLSPCPNCNSHPEEAPEGVHSIHSARKNGAVAGSAVWNHPHCWRCGYRPGVNVAVSTAAMQQAFGKFVEVMTQRAEALKAQGAVGFVPPANDQEKEDLKAQLAAATEREATLRAQLEDD